MKKLSQILEEISIIEKEEAEESALDEVSPPGKDYETWIKKNKARFIKQYGPEKGKQVLYARAWKMKNQYKTYEEELHKKKFNEAFTKQQIELLKRSYDSLEKIDVTSKEYKSLVALLDNLPQSHLKKLSKSNIKFVSSLARNRIKSIEERCWSGYKPTPGKKPYEKGSCMKEEDSDIMEESEYQGKKVTLNKPFRTPGGPKKFAVYVKNDKGNVVKVTFGDPNLSIKTSNPERRKSFRARHQCDTNPGPKWKARYWSCKFWSTKNVKDHL